STSGSASASASDVVASGTSKRLARSRVRPGSRPTSALTVKPAARSARTWVRQPKLVPTTAAFRSLIPCPPADTVRVRTSLIPPARVAAPGRPRIGRHNPPRRIDGRGGPAYVVEELSRGPAGARVDVGLAAGVTALVLIDHLTPSCGLGPAHVAVRVAGHVGEHMANGPAGQQARAPRALIREPPDGFEEARVRLGHPGDVGHGDDHGRQGRSPWSTAPLCLAHTVDPPAREHVRMSAFNETELTYLRGERRLGRVATVGADGTPHVAPVGWSYNPESDTID